VTVQVAIEERIELQRSHPGCLTKRKQLHEICDIKISACDLPENGFVATHVPQMSNKRQFPLFNSHTFFEVILDFMFDSLFLSLMKVFVKLSDVT
jgi:hypothetical protein